jgi:hypothetical protein
VAGTAPVTTASTAAATPVTVTTPATVSNDAEAADSQLASTVDPGADLAIDTEPGLDDPTSDEGHLASQPAVARVPLARTELATGDELSYIGDYPGAGLSPAPTIDYAIGADAGEATVTHPDPPSYETTTGDAAQPTDSTATDPGQPAYQTTTAVAGQLTSEAAQVEPTDDADHDQQTYEAAQHEAADETGIAQPEPGALPQFLRKWSSPTPPED